MHKVAVKTLAIPTSKQNMPTAQCTKIAQIFTPQCIHRHIASYLKEGELILNKNLDKRKKTLIIMIKIIIRGWWGGGGW